MKRFVSFILSLIMISSLCVPSMAADIDMGNEIDYERLATPREIYKQAQLFAKARGKQLLPEAVVFDQHQEENQDKNVLSTVGVMPVPDSAVEVKEGKGSSQTLTAKGEKWFTFKTPSGGAYNIYTTGSVNTYGVLYKKGLRGLSVITESGRGGKGNNFKIEEDLKNNTIYYVKVSGGTTSANGSFRFYFAGNRDSKSSTKGGEWRWSTMDVDPDGAFFNIDQITYLNSTQAAGYYSVVATDNIRKVRDAVINLSTTKAIEWIMNYYGVSTDVAKWILDVLAVGSAVIPQIPSLTSTELKSIAKASGRNPETGVCSKGLIVYSVTTYTSTGSGGAVPVPMNTYGSWNGSMMYGEKYYRGKFETPINPKPLWR